MPGRRDTWGSKNLVSEKTSLVLRSGGYTKFTGQRGKGETFGAEGTSCGNNLGWEGACRYGRVKEGNVANVQTEEENGRRSEWTSG